jgi:hypothetical protein
MVATAFDNVIKFPAGGRFPTLPGERILVESRDLVARRLREALRAMLEHVAEQLLKRGDVADDREQRNFLYRLKDSVVDKGGRLEAQLAAHWARQFDAVVAGSKNDAPAELRLEDLQIVDDNVLDEELALKGMSSRLHGRCEEDIYAIARRLGILSGRENPRDEENPASPEVFAKALDGALRDVDFDAPSRLMLLQCIDPLVGDRLAPIYRELNSNLVRHNVLPSLRRGYGKTAGFTPTKSSVELPGGDLFAMLQRLVSNPADGRSAGPGPVSSPGSTSLLGGGTGGSAGAFAGFPVVPMEQVWASLDALQRTASPAYFAPGGATPVLGTNVLREFRTSDVGQGLGQLDAITVDIVAMLFDMIFDDRAVSDPIKALVGKLQIPVLKVAILDKSFFSSKAHPTRRLLDMISRAAVRWGRDVGHDDPIYRKIAEIIEQIHNEFKQDTALFDALCMDLEAFLSEQEEAADAQAARAAPLVFQREQEEMALLAVEETLRPWLSSALPAAVANVLDREWRALLRLTRRESGGVSEAWESLVRSAADLVASVQPKPDVQERRALARSLPCLVKQIGAGLDRLNVDPDRRHQIFDALFSLHAAVLRGAEPLAEPIVTVAAATDAAPAEPVIASDELADGDVTVENISLSLPVGGDNAAHGIEGLQRGDWIEIRQEEGGAIRYRLSWISPQRGIYLFTNPQSPRALAISPEALALQVQRGEVCIVQVEPIFDRAVTRALEALQAA